MRRWVQPLTGCVVASESPIAEPGPLLPRSGDGRAIQRVVGGIKWIIRGKPGSPSPAQSWCSRTRTRPAVPLPAGSSLRLEESNPSCQGLEPHNSRTDNEKAVLMVCGLCTVSYPHSDKSKLSDLIWKLPRNIFGTTWRGRVCEWPRPKF